MTQPYQTIINNIRKNRSDDQKCENLYGGTYEWQEFHTSVLRLIDSIIDQAANRDQDFSDLPDKSKIALFSYFLSTFFEFTFNSKDNVNYLAIAQEFLARYSQSEWQDDFYYYNLPSDTNYPNFVSHIINNPEKWKLDATE